ncbi:MAG: DUF5343 domain-containing protein [Planctomycetes bacterium]|nr:DUF5343 domain-containing protein [Planctomycetota bacterium]
MATMTEAAKLSPPYVSYLTFRNFIESLHSSVVPDHIDRGMMPNLSGGSQSHLMLSMRFLGLIEGSEDRVTGELRQLVESYGTERWKDALAAVLKAAYAGIVDGIEIERVTERRLRKAFEENGGVDGSVLDRCVRFYVKALADAGAKVSPHVGQRKKRQNFRRNGKTQRRPAPEPAGATETRGSGGPPASTNSVPVFLGPGRNGSVVFPPDLTAEECEKFAAAVDYLRQLVK